MADVIETIITQAVEDAGIGDGTETAVLDVGSVTEEVPQSGEDGTDVPDGSSGDGTTKLVDEKLVALTEADKLLDKQLEELGMKAPGADGKGNRIPYARVRKIVDNAQKKLTEAHAKDLTDRDTKITTLQSRADLMDRIEALAEQDPEKYIGHLAALHPEKYGRFVGKPPVTTPGTGVSSVNDPMPEPDVTFADKSKGYSPEQHTKLLAWNRREAVREAETSIKEQYEKRFGPLEGLLKDKEAQQTLAARSLNVKKATEKARETWGELFTADEALGAKSEILAALQADSQATREANAPLLAFNKSVPPNQRRFLQLPTPFAEIVAKVLLPKVASNRATMREELIEELNKQTGERRAASKAVVPATKAVVDPNEVRDTEDIIREAMAEAGLK